MSVAGTTNLNGVAVWAVNDLAIFSGSVWQKVSNSNPTIITANSSTPALTVTQTGTGNALVVEDSASDTTPFVIDNAGNVSVGGTLTVAGFAVVDQSDIGTAPNEIPLNQYLGSMAYQDRLTVNIGGGVATLGTATVTTIQNDTAISNVEPSLMLNFAAVEALDPRITYTRASTATYYNGVTTAVAEQNLLLQSQTFDNASWNKTNGTVTADAIAAPDGTTTADLFTENTATGGHDLLASGLATANQPTVFSVFIKPNGRTVVRLDYANSNSYFVLATLTGSGTINGGTGTVTALANGWYLLACTITPTSASSAFRIKLCESVGGGSIGVTSYTGDGTSGVYLWGAQLENRSAVSAYTPTTTQTITNYIPVLLTAASGVPRFDHNPISGDSLGFLVEEQRTNLFTYSSQFDDAAWTKLNATITANTIVAPDGTLAGDALTTSGAAVAQRVAQSPTATGSLSFSVYAKAGSAQFIQILQTTDGNVFGNFDLANGVVGTKGSSATSTITAVGNGWYRCSVSATLASSNNWGIYITPSASAAYGALYTATVANLFIWGAQLEAGAFPTSYIATVASQVTRAVDSASITGTNFSSWFNQGEGSLYTEYARLASNSDIGLSFREAANGNFNNYTTHLLTNSNDRLAFATINAVSQVDLIVNLPGTSYVKIASAYKVNDVAASLNGASVLTDNLYTPSNNLAYFIFSYANNAAGNGYIKKIVYYPRRLSNEELQEMTS